MGIRQRSKGHWEIEVFLGRDENGKRNRIYDTVQGKKADAEKRLGQILNDLDRGITPATTKYKVGEWLDRWLDEKRTEGKRTKTIDRYEGIIRLHLKPNIGMIPMDKLTPLQVKELEMSLVNNGMDPKGVDQVHRVLNAALHDAFTMELIGRNPAAPVKPPKRPKKKVFIPEVSRVKLSYPKRTAPGIT